MATTQPEGQAKFCSVCGEPAADVICRRCQDKIQGEAAHKKQQVEREVKTDSGRR